MGKAAAVPEGEYSEVEIIEDQFFLSFRSHCSPLQSSATSYLCFMLVNFNSPVYVQCMDPTLLQTYHHFSFLFLYRSLSCQICLSVLSVATAKCCPVVIHCYIVSDCTTWTSATCCSHVCNILLMFEPRRSFDISSFEIKYPRVPLTDTCSSKSSTRTCTSTSE